MRKVLETIARIKPFTKGATPALKSVAFGKGGYSSNTVRLEVEDTFMGSNKIVTISLEQANDLADCCETKNYGELKFRGEHPEIVLKQGMLKARFGDITRLPIDRINR